MLHAIHYISMADFACLKSKICRLLLCTIKHDFACILSFEGTRLRGRKYAECFLRMSNKQFQSCVVMVQDFGENCIQGAIHRNVFWFKQNQISLCMSNLGYVSSKITFHVIRRAKLDFANETGLNLT